jgi:hypothetical protein
MIEQLRALIRDSSNEKARSGLLQQLPQAALLMPAQVVSPGFREVGIG